MSKQNLLTRLITNEFAAKMLAEQKKQELDFYVAGATGYVGRSLIETLSFVSKQFNLKITIWISERDAIRMQSSFLNFHNIRLLKKDLLVGAVLERPISHIIFLANPQFSNTNSIENNLKSLESKIWIDNLVKYLVKNGSVRLLYASSGAVYSQTKSVSETIGFNETAPLSVNSGDAYGELKKYVELKLNKAIVEQNASIAIPRMFTFYGPNLPLGSNFLIGNLMQAAINNQVISLKSDGSTRRSYMHTYEMSARLLQIIFSDFKGSINLGSPQIISVEKLSLIFKDLFGIRYILNSESKCESFYVPDTSLLVREYGLLPDFSFKDSLIEWFEDERKLAER
jgi:UDP-glucuronate decarboxylase